MAQAAQRRWDWIHAFLAATLHAVIDYLDLRVHRHLHFQDFIQAYTQRVQARLQGASVPALPRTPSPEELRYIFHLEGEVWGNHWVRYTFFFDTAAPSNGEILETFRFVMAFFIIDRCLDLFLSEQDLGNLGRRSRRRKFFGRNNGFFTVQAPHLLASLGPPFFLYANTRQALPLASERATWQRLQASSIPEALRGFYRHTTNGKHHHFTSILERAFVRARADFLVPKLSRRNQKRLPQQTYAWWYDVLWHYSESMRYRAVAPSHHAQTRPFFWNRSIRWFTSLVVTGLLNIVARQSPLVKTEWQHMQRHHPVLGPLYAGVTRFVGGVLHVHRV